MLGNTVRRWREERGWTQVDLAKRSGVSQNHVSAIETGKLANPRADTSEKLARAFGVTIDELYQDTRNERKEAEAPEERMARAFAELSPEEQENVLFLVERIRRSRGIRIIE